jgi:hypothetical protein
VPPKPSLAILIFLVAVLNAPLAIFNDKVLPEPKAAARIFAVTLLVPSCPKFNVVAAPKALIVVEVVSNTSKLVPPITLVTNVGDVL